MNDRDLRISVLLTAMDKASGPIKAIREESRKAGKAVRDTGLELTRLEKAQKDLKGFRDLKRGLKTTTAELDAARSKAAKLGGEIAATDKPTKTMISTFARAKREAAELGRSFDLQQTELQQVRNRLKEAGISTRNLVADERALKTQVAATNEKLAAQRKHYADLSAAAPKRIAEARAEAGIDRDRLRLKDARRERLNDRMNTGGGIVGTAIYVASTAAGIEAIKTAATFESKLTDIGQKTGYNRTQVTRLGEALNKLAPRTGQKPLALAEGVDTLAANGLDRDLLLKAINPLAKTATAYKVPIPTLAAAGFAAVNNLEVPIAQMLRVQEIMAAGDNRGAFGVESMALALPGLTAQFESLGQKGVPAVADLVAALETIRPAAADSEEAGNNLTNLLDKITASDTEKNFKKYKIDLPVEMKLRMAKGQSPIEAFTEITQQVLDKNPGKLGYLIPDRQAKAALRPLLAKLAQYKTLRDEVQKSQGAIDAAFANRQKDTRAKWDKVTAEWEKTENRFGDAMRPAVNWLLDKAAYQLRDRDPDPDLMGKGKLQVAIMKKLQATAKLQRDRARKAALPRQQQAQPAPRAQQWGQAAPRPPRLLQAPPPQPRAQPVLALRRSPATFQRPRMPMAARGVAPARAALPAPAIRPNLVAAQAEQQRANAKMLADAARWRAQIAAKYANRNDFVSAGVNMMLGLEQGMASRFPAVRARVLAMSNTLRAAFRTDMQIRSPSRVFAGYGRHIAEGLGIGIDQGSSFSLDSVARLGRRVSLAGAAMAMPALADLRLRRLPGEAAQPAAAFQIPAQPQRQAGASSPAGGATHYHNDTYQIVLPAGAGGAAGDARALARQILQEIEKLQRGRDTRSYQDD